MSGGGATDIDDSLGGRSDDRLMVNLAFFAMLKGKNPSWAYLPGIICTQKGNFHLTNDSSRRHGFCYKLRSKTCNAKFSPANVWRTIAVIRAVRKFAEGL